MKIAIATGVQELNEKINQMLSSREDLETKIIDNRSNFQKNQFDIAIISEKLIGNINIDKLFFILKSKDTRVIYITGEENVEEIKTCFNYQINDILFYSAKEEDIVNLVLKPNSFSDISDIYLKYSSVGSKKVVEKIVEKPVVVKETVYKSKILKQKIFTFYTTDNALLTADLISQIGVLLSQKVEQKILILDFNTLFPVMDHFLGINKNVDIESKYDIGDNTSLVAMYNAVERNILNSSNFSNFVKKHPKYKNLDIATGLYDLVLFEKMPNEYFEKIIDTAAAIYDTILINTNPDISLGSTFVPITKATDIICVTEANYTEIRNLLFVINGLKSKISQDKFKIVLSNMTDKSLDEETIKEIFKGYDILSYIPYDEGKEVSLNEQKPFISKITKKKLAPYTNILENLGYLPKTSFLNKVFGDKKPNKILKKDAEIKGGKKIE